ncbi:MAG: hypothetical protein NHF86_01755 [Candidatus Bostrichicola ureolyticus]|nr:MAG: hypothetical protein NHF86_01755 [Candidatus Bostrichicola ureolyticus]
MDSIEIKKKGYTITKEATMLIIEYLGTDISNIANELKKISIILPVGSNITYNFIKKNITLSNYYHFKLYKYIAIHDSLNAYKLIFNLKENESIIPILNLLFKFFTKLIDYHLDKNYHNTSYIFNIAAKNYSLKKIIKIISFIRKADIQSKGIDSCVKKTEILKELIYHILN